jgi:uncharacterized YigZ family protein
VAEAGKQSVPFLIPAEEKRAEHKVMNSRFVASIGPAESIDAAKAFLARIRAEFPDASHNVPAFVIGGGNSSTDFCSDDGEPSGTAGRPILTVLKGSGLGDVVVVVSRYFGGTKLGKGGLVKAYTESAQLVVSTVPRARRILVGEFSISLPYPLLEKARKSVRAHHGTIISEEFSETIQMTVSMPEIDLDPFQRSLRDLSSGQVVVGSVAFRHVLSLVK